MLSQGLDKVDCRGQFISGTCVELHELLNKGLWLRVVSVWRNKFGFQLLVGNGDRGKIHFAWNWLHSASQISSHEWSKPCTSSSDCTLL